MRQAHANARLKRKVWVDDNRPRGMMHDSYKEYKTAKKNFRNMQRKAIFQHENETFNQLNVTAENDIRLFWRLLKRTKRKSSNITVLIRARTACSKGTLSSVPAHCKQSHRFYGEIIGNWLPVRLSFFFFFLTGVCNHRVG